MSNLNKLYTEPIKLPLYEEVYDACPLPNIDQYLNKPTQLITKHLIITLLNKNKLACIDLSQLVMNSQFISNTCHKKKSILYLKVIE